MENSMEDLKGEEAKSIAVARRLAARPAFGRRMTPLSNDHIYRLRILDQIAADLKIILSDQMGNLVNQAKIEFVDMPGIEVRLRTGEVLCIEIDKESAKYCLTKIGYGADADFVIVSVAPEIIIDSVVAQVFFSGRRGGAVERALAADTLCSLLLVDSQRLICGRALHANRGDRLRTAQALGLTVGELRDVLAGNRVVVQPPDNFE